MLGPALPPLATAGRTGNHALNETLCHPVSSFTLFLYETETFPGLVSMSGDGLTLSLCPKNLSIGS